MRPIIFLDIDGVINTQRHQRSLAQEHKTLRDDNMPYFDPEAVANLRHIIQHTEASVVITSSWRHKGFAVMEDVWYSRHMPGILEGITPTVTTAFFSIRGHEILQWLASQEEEICYVIIDDANDFLPEQTARLVQTNPYCGLSRIDAERSIEILTHPVITRQ